MLLDARDALLHLRAPGRPPSGQPGPLSVATAAAGGAQGLARVGRHGRTRNRRTALRVVSRSCGWRVPTTRPSRRSGPSTRTDLTARRCRQGCRQPAAGAGRGARDGDGGRADAAVARGEAAGGGRAGGAARAARRPSRPRVTRRGWCSRGSPTRTGLRQDVAHLLRLPGPQGHEPAVEPLDGMRGSCFFTKPAAPSGQQLPRAAGAGLSPVEDQVPAALGQLEGALRATGAVVA